MSLLTAQDFESMLSEYGWSFNKVGDNQWDTGFQGTQRYFPLSIKLSHTCVSFEVRPLIDLLIDVTSHNALPRDLLELNSRIQVAKLAVNDLGEVSLACQVLANNFSSETLGRILGIIGYYADEVAPDIYQRIASCCIDDAPQMLS